MHEMHLMELSNCTSAYLTSCIKVFQIVQTNRNVCFLNELVEFFVASVNLILLVTTYYKIINNNHNKFNNKYLHFSKNQSNAFLFLLFVALYTATP